MHNLAEEIGMPSFLQQRRTNIVIISAIAGAVWAIAPNSASAAPHDGKSPSSVSGCTSNSRIGGTRRITAYNQFTRATEDYGWFEWRYSNSGSCSGYQWVRLHIERALLLYNGGVFYPRYWRTNNSALTYYYPIQPSQVNITIWGGMWSALVSKMNPGTFNGKLFYSPGVVSCASLSDVFAHVSTWDFYGYSRLQGQICA
jgi:hypothetical protein